MQNVENPTANIVGFKTFVNITTLDKCILNLYLKVMLLEHYI